VHDYIEFRGFENDPSVLFNNAGMFLNFSTSESFSMTCLEALSYGVPVIATRSGGPEEILDNGKCGLLVNNGDIAAMADAIKLLASNPEARARLSQAGIERVLTAFNPVASKQQFTFLYQRLLK